MKKPHWFCLSACVLVLAPARAQAQQMQSLVPAETLEKLQLSAEQKEKYGKINAEFKVKSLAIVTKSVKGAESGDGKKLLAAAQQLLADTTGLRKEYLGKFDSLLTDSQKGTFTAPRSVGKEKAM